MFKTQGFQGYAVEFSPFFDSKLAVASGANFGIVGNGRLWVLSLRQDVSVDITFDTQDGLFDVAWSEGHENQLVTASGDGSIKLWDTTLPEFPLKNWHEHTKEVFSVNWNLMRKDLFVTGSWDQSIKVWNPETQNSIFTYREHTHCIYNTVWSPRSADVFASASGDQTIKLWDTRSSQSATTFHAHNAEILALDWNKYRPSQLVTGSVDHTLKSWDLRNSAKPLNTIYGHEYAIRRVKCSPHKENLVGSCGYDMSMRTWDMDSGNEISRFDGHTEFVFGLDFSLFDPGLTATCAWDEGVAVFRN